MLENHRGFSILCAESTEVMQYVEIQFDSEAEQL